MWVFSGADAVRCVAASSSFPLSIQILNLTAQFFCFIHACVLCPAAHGEISEARWGQLRARAKIIEDSRKYSALLLAVNTYLC